ncbi:hypothetical protein HMPREF9404_3244 [Eggerthella sp. HGA1]|nr:hypothetical protein HMPREF9404_3244 [Eggerthella sp. HGA1]
MASSRARKASHRQRNALSEGARSAAASARATYRIFFSIFLGDCSRERGLRGYNSG